MASSKHVVFDSDDDGDDLSPLSSPLASPQLSPLPLPPITTTTATNPPDASTSTDLSFFRDVYEEQQRAIGAQLAPLHTALDDSRSQDDAPKGVAHIDQSSRDPWEVPSSPIEVAGQQRGSYLKRKREEGEQQQEQANRQANVSVVVQLDDLSSGSGSHVAGPAKTKKQKRTDADNTGGSTGIEIISIPLEPLTPSRMHQYQRLHRSSINDDPAATHDASLPRRLGLNLGLEDAADPAHQAPYEDPLPPNEGVTQSTIAFTTPSLYASSGRRALGSSNNNSYSILKQMKSSSSHDMDVMQEEEAIAAQNATPPRRVRKAADLAQIMSSPDIIAEPAARESPRHQSPLPEQIEEHKEHEEGGVEWEAHSTTKGASSTESTRQQPRQRRSSVADELSFSIDGPAQGEVVQEIYETDASYDSLKQKRLAKAKKKSSKKKAIFIAASDDEDEDVIVAFPPAESESDFSDVPVKSKTTAKGKRGPKKKAEVLSVELLPDLAPSKPKRSRGRPKRQNTPQQEVESDEDILVQGGGEDKIKVEPAESKTDEYAAAADSEADSEAELDPPSPVKTKGKKGKKAAKDKKDTKAGRGRKATKADAAASKQDAAEEKTVLGKTSGNASATSSFKGEDHNVEDEQESQTVAVSAKEEKKLTPPSPGKPATTTAPERTAGLLNTGLHTTAGQGRVPYRVGLSKKFRIAPLLKMIRK